MKSFRKELWFKALSRRAYINNHAGSDACLRESGIREGTLSGQRHAHYGKCVYQR